MIVTLIVCQISHANRITEKDKKNKNKINHKCIDSALSEADRCTRDSPIIAQISCFEHNVI